MAASHHFRNWTSDGLVLARNRTKQMDSKCLSRLWACHGPTLASHETSVGIRRRAALNFQRIDMHVRATTRKGAFARPKLRA
jgi:hypothetical protein